MAANIKVVRCNAPGELVLASQPSPGNPPKGWAIVDISQVGICGTDYHIYEGKHPFLAYPRVIGHEVSGTVAAVNGPADVSVGQMVIVNPYLSCGKCRACAIGKPNCCTVIEVLGVHRDGAMAEQILVPAQNLYPADGLSPVEAACVEFLAIGAHGVRRSMAGLDTRALVIGAGPIGLGVALFARIAGQHVTVLDLKADRAAFAADKLGFQTVDSPESADANSDGAGYDVVYEATGNSASMTAAFKYVAHGGVMVMLSVVQDDIAFSDPAFHKREMMVIGSRNATHIDFDHVVASILAGRIPVNLLVTHRTTLANSPRDIARWAHHKSGLIKAVINVGRSG
jgi:2-desacetyl-2-hydroxyethyl bacteriochlorophyllide A dehydrogenase